MTIAYSSRVLINSVCVNECFMIDVKKELQRVPFLHTIL